jgi:hypothetical protein
MDQFLGFLAELVILILVIILDAWPFENLTLSTKVIIASAIGSSAAYSLLKYIKGK